MILLPELETERKELAERLQEDIVVLKQQSLRLAESERDYRKARARAWIECPTDGPGEKFWTAKRREDWVDAETADQRYVRDMADGMRDSAREAIRARATELSAWQTLVSAHKEEAAFARTGP